jgi:hypothetical protein
MMGSGEMAVMERHVAADESARQERYPIWAGRSRRAAAGAGRGAERRGEIRKGDPERISGVGRVALRCARVFLVACGKAFGAGDPTVSGLRAAAGPGLGGGGKF